MSHSKKQNIEKKLNFLKFILLTLFIALLFFLIGNIIFFSKQTFFPSDFRGNIDLKKEMNDVLFKESEAS